MSRTVARADAVAMTVGEVMIRAPKTLPAGTSVGEVRRLFERPSIRTVILTAGSAFAGAIERGELPVDVPDGAPARAYVETETVTATAEMPMSEAIELLESRGEPRLIVLGADGATLVGLLCANESATGFCVRP
jgi:CBS domain-containing protein